MIKRLLTHLQGNSRRYGLLLSFIILGTIGALAFVNAYTDAGLPAPIVTSDKDDYAPGEIAHITGSGWTLDEQVHVEFKETPDYPDYHIYDVTVNSDGTWQIDYQIEGRHVGVAFTVTTSGKQTGATATTVFTDANVRVTTSSGQMTLSYRVANTTNCSGPAASTGTRVATTNQGQFDAIAVGSNQSVQITAPLTNSEGYTFSGFTVSGGTEYTIPNPANPNIICVRGSSGNGTLAITANYVACTAPVITVPNNIVVNSGSESCGITAPAAFTATATGSPSPTITYSVMVQL